MTVVCTKSVDSCGVTYSKTERMRLESDLSQNVSFFEEYTEVRG